MSKLSQKLINIIQPIDHFDIPVLYDLATVYQHLHHVEKATHGEEADTVASYLDDTSRLLGKIEDNLISINSQNSWLTKERTGLMDLLDAICEAFDLQVLVIAEDQYEQELRDWFASINLPYAIFKPSLSNMMLLFRSSDEVAVRLRWHEIFKK